MDELLKAAMIFGGVLVACYAIDALTTNSPSRRQRDLTDIKVIGDSLGVLRTL